MKIYLMKKSALDYLKANMSSLYKNYYQFDTPDWIGELFDYDPFEFFKEIPDFELASLALSPGEVDLQNSKILYTKLGFLSDSQASDERLWAGLCNKTFYAYMRKRWEYAKRHLKKTSDDADAITLRYFYKSTGRSGMFRNTLARCWWTGRLTYTTKYQNHWELLDALGPEDWVSKVSDILYSNTYSSNDAVLEGFCEALKFFRDRNIRVANRQHIRPTAQYLNAVGGGVLLDMFTADEVKNLVVEHMGKLIKGVDMGIIAEAVGETEALDPDTEDDVADAEEVNVDYTEYLESLEQTTEIDLDAVLGELETVEYGCKVHIRKTPENTFFISHIPMAGQVMRPLERWLLGKTIGEVKEMNNSYYTIVDIRR